MKKVSKQILVLTSEFPPLPGGIGNHAYNMAEYLQRSGYIVKVIADQRSDYIREKEFDQKLNSEIYRVKLQSVRFWMYFNRIYKFLKLKRSANIIICSGKFPLWLGGIVSMFSKKVYIAVIHGSEVNFKNKWLKKITDWALIKYNKVIAVSNYTRNLVNELNLKSIRVIPNGYNPFFFDEKENHIVNLKGFPKLLTVGNISERKGQANVIKHLPELLKIFPNIHYHCVGLSSNIEVYMKLVDELEVKEHVTFHGYLTVKELKRKYKSVDICVMLSSETKTGDIEGFGIALIEANHFGVPTIGSIGCGIEDAIDNNNSGLLINPNNSKEFSNAIQQILSNNNHFKNQAKLWAKQHDWQSIINDYKAFIES